MKNSSILKKVMKALFISSHAELVFEANGVEMEKNVKVIMRKQNNQLEPLFVAFYDRVNHVFYDIATSESYSEKELSEYGDLMITNFYLINFNKYDQEQMVSDYESFKRNHAFLFDKVSKDNMNINQRREEVIEKLRIYEAVKAEEFKEILELTNLLLSMTTDEYLSTLDQLSYIGDYYDVPKDRDEYIRLSNKLLDLQENLITKQVTGYFEPEDGIVYLTDQHQVVELGTNELPTSIGTKEGWMIRPYTAPRSFKEEVLENEDDVNYLYTGLENFKFNHPSVKKDKKLVKEKIQ